MSRACEISAYHSSYHNATDFTDDTATIAADLAAAQEEIQAAAADPVVYNTGNPLMLFLQSLMPWNSGREVIINDAAAAEDQDSHSD